MPVGPGSGLGFATTGPALHLLFGPQSPHLYDDWCFPKTTGTAGGPQAVRILHVITSDPVVINTPSFQFSSNPSHYVRETWVGVDLSLVAF